ncbi:T-complex protein 1 subunit delta [Corvus cornix cornix]|uniref:T-complex protein 1 subunit delta n=1 Tax=Corvus moneduloides TaxID=1196302 RepID=A0A8C3EQL1_CORMO|nr:T-complex protein 1 subunit delta [Corvus moneduloides]XP_039425579.1 T-complex protein 1 subunit delta [Corvus cornix cornix]XP_041905174.1 T-complex protein 1 subunit delta [Corvus kubaryi]
MPESAPGRAPGGAGNRAKGAYQDRDKPAQIRFSNIAAGKAVADAIRTSLGPKGMDKMIQDAKGDVTITNDGATILKQMQVLHPAAKMLVELSKAQDIEAGDGTTSVVVIAGALLDACSRLLQKGIHPTIISESFQKALDKGIEVLTNMAQPVELSDRETLLNSATTSLNSKVVCQYSSLLSPMSVDAVMKVIDPATANSVDLRDIKIVKKLGGTIDDCELVEGLVLTQKVANTGVTRVEKAKIGLIQFCLSAPKTDMDNQIVVSDYAQMDRVLREERAYILNLVKQIKKAGCNVLLIQKSILRDALSDLALHFLNKVKIMVVKDIEREDIEFICKTIGTKPVAHIDQFTPDMLGSAELAEEVNLNGSGKLVKITGCTNPGKTVSIVVRGSNKLVLEEAERSIHDALCVIRCLVKKRALIAGGGAPEIELALRLNEYARTLKGMESYCVRAYGDALEVIPSTLAENAGLNPISTVTELRNRHAQGEKTAGINVRKGGISNILEELVVQPLLVSLSALTLATETVRSILKIDDVVNTRG